jgi:Protein of unknown function DUF262
MAARMKTPLAKKKVPPGGADTEAELFEDFGDGFPPAERKVVTQSYDLSVQTLADEWEAESLYLPEIQREYVWDNPRASRLVESLLLNIPIPVLYFAETDDAKWEIFDGHQRVLSVVRFLGNEFRLSGLPVLGELNGSRFHQLPEREQRFLKTRMMRAVVISADSHPSMKFEIFERLNTGAVILNAQELRNSIYRGPFNDLLRELVKDEKFRACIGTVAPRRRMADEEFILRFFALRARLKNYRPPLKKFLNDYMFANQEPSKATLSSHRRLFSMTINRIHTIFGPNAFKPTDRNGRATERAPNRALFDAQMLAFSWVGRNTDISKRTKDINRKFGALYRDEGFMDSISLATGDRSRLLARVQSAIDTLNRAGVSVRHKTPRR